MTASIDETIRAHAVRLSPTMQLVVAELPWRLGLSPERDGRWDQFVRIPSNGSLPSYALVGGKDCSRSVEPFVRAHHCAAAWGILADRLNDRQVELCPEFVALRLFLRRCWEQELTLGLGRAADARCAIARALVAWRRGCKAELRERGEVGSVTTYVTSILDRLQWITTSASCAIAEVGRAAALERGYLCFLVALQLRDDALDAEEDRLIHGRSAPERLCLPEAAFHAAAPALMHVAADHLDGHEFRRLAAEIREFGRGVGPPTAVERTHTTSFAAMVLVSAAIECLELPPPVPGYRSTSGRPLPR